MRIIELLENQKFDFEKYKPQIISFVQRTKNNKNSDIHDVALFYDIITNKPTVGSAKGLTIDPQTWKSYFTNKAFNSNGVWSQRDFNINLKGDQNNINFYITIEKSNDNIKRFIQKIGSLDSDLLELSNKTKTRISYKTHTILDSFVDHNDSLKIYYNDPQLKPQIQSVVKKWATNNNIILAKRTHDHGLDTNQSFGERLATSINNTVKAAIKKNDTYTDEQWFEWIKRYLPVMIQKANDTKQ